MDILCLQRRLGTACTTAVHDGARFMPQRSAWLPVLGACLALAGCNPALNWRVARLDGAPVQALLPCKPERAERQVPLTASGTTLRLMSCKAGGLTFALALAAWAAASAWATINAAAPSSGKMATPTEACTGSSRPSTSVGWAMVLSSAEQASNRVMMVCVSGCKSERLVLNL